MVSGCRKQLVEPLLADGSAALFVSRSRAADPAQFRGCTPATISALKSAFPALGNPAKQQRRMSSLATRPLQRRFRSDRARDATSGEVAFGPKADLLQSG